MSSNPIAAYAKLNIRIGAITRGKLFEDRLTDAIGDSGVAEVTGGGTMSSEEDGEIQYCGIDLTLFDLEQVDAICETLDELGAPKGSALIYEVDGKAIEMPFGTLEGLALYLNGTDLPDETSQTCDINDLIKLIHQQLGDTGILIGNWNGPVEIGLYIYGKSYDAMKNSLAPLLATHPLCERARVVQIA